MVHDNGINPLEITQEAQESQKDTTRQTAKKTDSLKALRHFRQPHVRSSDFTLLMTCVIHMIEFGEIPTLYHHNSKRSKGHKITSTLLTLTEERHNASCSEAAHY